MADPTAPAPAPLSLVARFIGVITSPKATFENVVAAPRPIGILLVVALLISVGSTVPQFTDAGRRATLDMQVKSMERFGVEMTPEVYQKLEAQSNSPVSKVFAVIGAFIMLPIGSLIFAAIFWAFFNVALGGTASFKQALAVITHSQVISALGILAALPIQLAKGTMTMAGPFNLGALAPMLEEGSTLASFLGSISVFGLWGFVVQGIGLGVLYRRSGRNIAIVLIIIYLLFMFAITAAFGSFMGRSA